jgi:hypothetical protein
MDPPAISDALASIMYMLSTHSTDGSEFSVFSLVCWFTLTYNSMSVLLYQLDVFCPLKCSPRS